MGGRRVSKRQPHEDQEESRKTFNSYGWLSPY
jgi:hypothetical protein